MSNRNGDKSRHNRLRRKNISLRARRAEVLAAAKNAQPVQAKTESK